MTTAKINEFPDFFGQKIVKSKDNVSIFYNFLTRKSQETRVFFTVDKNLYFKFLAV